MIIKRNWYKIKYVKGQGKMLVVYEGWFLLGVLPLYVRGTIS